VARGWSVSVPVAPVAALEGDLSIQFQQARFHVLIRRKEECRPGRRPDRRCAQTVVYASEAPSLDEPNWTLQSNLTVILSANG
jgi:hypothetical protein